MIIGRQFAERMYSDYDYEERLYSTGNDELDDLLERAFCDGYEYAQREYAEKMNEEKKKHIGAKIAVGAGAATLGSAGVIYGGKKLGEVVEKKGRTRQMNIERQGEMVDPAWAEQETKKYQKAAKQEKLGKNMQKPYDKVEETAKKAGNKAKETYGKAKEGVKSGYENTKAWLKAETEGDKKRVEKMTEELAKKYREKDPKLTKKAAKEMAEKVAKRTNMIGKGAMIALPVAALGTGIGVAAHHHKKNKEN